MNGINKADIKDLANGIYNAYTIDLDKKLLIEFLADTVFQRDEVVDIFVSTVEDQVDELKELSNKLDDLTELITDKKMYKSFDDTINKLDTVINNITNELTRYKQEVIEE